MGISIGSSKLGKANQIDFFKTMSGWLNSGAGRMSVNEAVTNTCDAYSHDEFAGLKPKMDMIRNEFQSGQTSLYQALAMADVGFQRQELAIVEAAEKSNQLRQSIPALVKAMDVQQSARRELKTKMISPIVIGILLIIMTFAVLLYMLPMVVGPTVERNPESLKKFPMLLQMYWYLSVWLRANLWFMFVLFGSPIAILFLTKTSLLRHRYQLFLLKWGVSRKIIITFNAVIVVYFMPALVRSGMPTPQVLSNLADCLNNPIISNLFKRAAQQHEQGSRIGDAVDQIPFRASFVNAVRAGDATGAIADRIEELQEPYALEMERQVKGVISALKFMVMAVLLPIFIISTYTALVGPIFALMEY